MRVKRGKTHLKRRKSLLKKTKGYLWDRKTKPKLAKVAVTKAGAHAYRDRRLKKRSFRQLWQIRINAAVRMHGMSYSAFISALKKKKIEIDRKILAELANDHPKVFEAIVKAVK
ncbi:50S ribosomal protein L20 [Patescibacteria group bacterium]|nr:50S ribosomal protein L20 [Patescibacteria group bacterium]MBU1891061.1 50S ribosomal protein L20 [Patescibacteria group bacterium]